MKFNWSYFIFLASALVLLTLSIFSYHRFEQQKISSEWVSHSYLVKLKLEDAMSTLIDAEGAQRGYLLTRDSTFLHTFLSSKLAIPKTISSLDSLVSYDPEQGQNLKMFAGLVNNRFRLLSSVIDTLQDISAEQLDNFLFYGKQVTDSARAQMKMMEKKEDLLLSQRITEKHLEEKRASVFILIFSFFSLAVLVYSFFRLKAERNLLMKSEYNAEVLEQKVNERVAEIKTINDQLTEQNLELERKNDDLASFSFITNHDLKEPLRKIEITADKIMRTEHQSLSDEGKIYFNRIISSAKRMQNLINSVLQYAQTNTIARDFQKLDLNLTAAVALETLNESIQEKEAVIEYFDLPTIRAVPFQMDQLFTNLIGNALKYSKTGVKPRIKIAAQILKAGVEENLLSSDAWKIEFADNGIGFDEINSEKIFQMFQRLHNKDDYSGTGVGLAICKKIAENHKGVLSVRSTPGVGSAFSIFLPQHVA